jgi:hypothetical protein
MRSATIVLILAALGATAHSQDAKPQELEATLVAFKGTVDVKRPEDKDWVAAERNMKLKKGSEVCTSVASGATLLFTSNLKIEVRPLTQAKVEELAKLGSDVNADVRLKFGSIEVDLQKGDLRSDMKVSAPNSTTSVKGSTGVVRAPATEGGCRITLRTSTGTWNHNASGVDREISGADVGDNYGNQLRDFRAFANSHDFMDFFGRDRDELYQGRFSAKSADSHPWEVPFFEFVSNKPLGPRTRRPSALPLPPGTP